MTEKGWREWWLVEMRVKDAKRVREPRGRDRGENGGEKNGKKQGSDVWNEGGDKRGI